jgi:hypothetical protein
MSYDGSNAVEEALESILPASPLDTQVGGQRLSLKQYWLYFREYTGPHLTTSLEKPIVGGPDRPFAELQAVTRLDRQGCVRLARMALHYRKTSFGAVRVNVRHTLGLWAKGDTRRGARNQFLTKGGEPSRKGGSI